MGADRASKSNNNLGYLIFFFEVKLPLKLKKETASPAITEVARHHGAVDEGAEMSYEGVGQ